MNTFVRRYRPGEELELWDLFFNTVRTVNIRDYDAEQVRAWAPDSIEQAGWRSRIQGNNPYVCVNDGEIVGFADLQESGHIDHFYVHHQWQRKGIGKRLLATIEEEAGKRRLTELSANVSITARPFFESQGFQVTATQEVRLGTVVMNNFRMLKRLELPRK